MSGDALTANDRRSLRRELSRVFNTKAKLAALLPEGDPLAAEAMEAATIEQAWNSVVDRCAGLPPEDGYLRLIKRALISYPYNEVFVGLTAILGPAPPADSPVLLDLEAGSSPPRPSVGTAWPLGVLRILAVATEWSSVHGGLSTFNRKLSMALAVQGAHVTCLVPTASELEVKQAAACGVYLLKAEPIPGGSERDALFRRASLPHGLTPDVIIGHGRITGPAAQIQRGYFPSALVVHIVHAAPDEIEWYKSGDGAARDMARIADERTRAELDLARKADLVAAVGPRLSDRFQLDLSGYEDSPPVLRLDPGFEAAREASRKPPPGKLVRVLLLGRMEDATLKGADIAAAAVGHAVRRMAGTRLELLVRGAPPGEASALREQILQWSGQPRLQVVTREYTVDDSRLTADLTSSSLLLMPSRAEGFGLAGVDAIEAGTPLLASQPSGLGEFLDEVLPLGEADRVVVRDGDDPQAAWKEKVLQVLTYREAAFQDADRLRTFLAAYRPWSAVAGELLAALSSLTPMSAGPP